ncbi:hypothetical protein QBC35DRAFT_447022 [Podospora australis]|uniref:BHLH domain-containing protein n=1 Tax=Podospora australis TaxID=1536484 RepID=A0AAN7AML3_9PEZI|nr:hypothetical protein QBC35DRAFT_447022 [Podospora australis]
MSAPTQNLSPDGQEGEKPSVLSDAAKKANHIASEQKRRQAIRDRFDDLSVIVPGLAGQARSEGTVLEKTYSYMRKQMLKRRDLIRQLDARGIAVPASLRQYDFSPPYFKRHVNNRCPTSSLESLPPGFLDADDGANASDGSPDPTSTQNGVGADGMQSGSPQVQSPQ